MVVLRTVLTRGGLVALGVLAVACGAPTSPVADPDFADDGEPPGGGLALDVDTPVAPGDGGAAGASSEPDGTIAAGGVHTCALDARGGVRCWGRNVHGQLGLGDRADRGGAPDSVPARLASVALGPGAAATFVAAGEAHTCAVLASGEVACWGRDEMGEASGVAGGAGAATDVPRRLASVAGAVAVALGDRHTCVATDVGAVRCWGSNEDGQTGPGGAAPHGVEVAPGRKVVALGAGGAHTCAVLDDASLRCWGANAAGQLGLEDTRTRGRSASDFGAALPAVDLGPGVRASRVATGFAHTCVLATDGRVLCWGANEAGQLGRGDGLSPGAARGTMGLALRAVDLSPGAVAVAIAAGRAHTCATLADGAVKCWGQNGAAQLGLGDRRPRGAAAAELGADLPSVDLGAGRLARGVAVGLTHSCARLEGPSVLCWGANLAGQLGVGDRSTRGAAPGEMGDALEPIRLE